MKINIYYFGKKTDFSSIQDEYEKRLSRFCDISIFQLKSSSINENNSMEEVMKNESIELLKKLPSGYKIALDREGKEFDSLSFSKLIEKLNDKGDTVSFIIGGVYGLDSSVIDNVDQSLSLSKLTFTHEISRILILEQIYRAFTIMNGKEYHY